MTKQEFEQKATELLDKCSDAVLTSVSEDGYPRSCMLGVVARDSYYQMYFTTGTSGTKVRHFKNNPKASVCYVSGPDTVTLTGEVTFITELAEKKKYWQNWMSEHFPPEGAESEEFCVIKFTGKEATFWIEQNFLRDEPIKEIPNEDCE